VIGDWFCCVIHSKMIRKILSIILVSILGLNVLYAQQPPTPVRQPEGPSLTPSKPVHSDSVTVTIILKHQQDKNLPEIRRILEAQGFWEMFPPKDARVISWTLAMGLGHIITLQVPAGSIRQLNLAIENGAWGAYDTEIHLTYDYLPIWKDYVQKREETKEEDKN
jgi:hypothetical protein